MPMSWFLYILRCKDESFYTGITYDIKRRVKEHNNRINTSLQISKVPVKLVYWERFIDRYQAAKREKEIKGWNRLKKQKLVDSLHWGAFAPKCGSNSVVECLVANEDVAGSSPVSCSKCNIEPEISLFLVFEVTHISFFHKSLDSQSVRIHFY